MSVLQLQNQLSYTLQERDHYKNILINEKNKFEFSIKELQNSIIQKNSEISNLRTRILILEKENIELKNSSIQKDSEISNLNTRIQTLEQENIQLNEKIQT